MRATSLVSHIQFVLSYQYKYLCVCMYIYIIYIYNKIAIQAKGPDGKWTRKPLAYREYCLDIIVIDIYIHIYIYINIIKVIILIFVVPHSKLISSLKPPHLLYTLSSVSQPLFYPVDYAIPDTMGF